MVNRIVHVHIRMAHNILSRNAAHFEEYLPELKTGLSEQSSARVIPLVELIELVSAEKL